MLGAPPLARTVPRYLAWRAGADPDHVAIEVQGATSLTFAEWDHRATVLASALRHRGVRAGDRVGLRFGPADWTDFAVAYCATQRAGAAAVPLSDRLPPVQVDHALTQCDAVGLIRADDCGWAGGWTTTTADLENGGGSRAIADDSPDCLAQILYTSGTTGRPKGVAATHANLTQGAPTHPRRLRLAHSARFAHAFAIGTNAAQTMLLNCLYARPGGLSLAQFTPARFARLIETPGVGTVFLVPSVAVELLNTGVLTGRDLSRVLLLGSTAAALPPAVAIRLAERFDRATIVNYYTSTEAAPAEASMIFDPDRPDAVGRAADGSLMIADAQGQPVPVGVTGDVFLRCPSPRRYYGDAAASATTFRGQWVRMGDIGRMDPDGYLYLTDRHEDVVKSGAFKVSTVEVEAAMYEHPQVSEVAVVGVGHAILGSVLAAFVVPRADAPAGSPTLPEVRRFLSTRLADYQVPAVLTLVDRLPRNEGGKVLKRHLASQFDSDTDTDSGTSATDANGSTDERGSDRP